MNSEHAFLAVACIAVACSAVACSTVACSAVVFNFLLPISLNIVSKTMYVSIPINNH